MKTETQEQREEKVRSLRPIDDLLFQELAEDKAVVQEMLRVILSDNGLIVKKVTPQRIISNTRGRRVQLDALCRLGDGRECNIEVQRADNDDHLRRVRYNASGITWTRTKAGTPFKDIRDLCVIYISEFDFLKGGYTLYHVDKVVRETGERVNDGLEEIFVNTSIDDGSAVADLMRCFLQAEVSTKEFPELTRKMQWVKHTEEGVSTMSSVIERYYGEELQEARKEALEEGKMKQIARLKFLCQKMQAAGADMSEYIEATTDENILEKLCGKYGIS